MATSATSSSAYDASEEKTNGTRLARLLVDVGTDVLRKFLHSMHPSDKLQTVLKNNQPKLRTLKSRRVIFDDQWEKMFPSTGDPDSSTFDITLLHLLIREVCHLHPPVTGWHKMPAEDDDSVQANITRIKCFRNELCHSVSTDIPSDEFEIKWNKISSSLEAIEGEVYRRKIQVLKDDPIDHVTRQAMKEQVEQWRQLEQQEKDEVTDELRSYLPDKLPEERIFGRSQEVEEVKINIQSGKFAVVLITGGPGFGKTTVAKAVAYELAKPENGKVVLFCSLLSKVTFNEVATEMIYLCGKITTPMPENPDQWLKEWSKQIQMGFTFVLDNADGVLESKSDRDLFLRTLCDMRTLSKKKVTFVITSRQTLEHPDLPSTDVRLDELLHEEAKKILLSRVKEKEIQEKLCETEQIVKLCGCVPLALCNVGALLSYYTEKKLIKHLEDEPLTTLEGYGGRSFRMAIKTSFDLLSKVEQQALVLLSVFSGTFDCDAAEAVITACSNPGTLPLSILRSLESRSLIEQPRPRRYQLHPLVRAYAKEIGENKREPPSLDLGEKLACAHFMSRLNENSKMYWSKDKCQAAIKSFSDERHNFEHFLEVYTTGLENRNHEVIGSCQDFLDEFLHKCMYLEMCLSPWVYVQFLKKLLKSFTEANCQPVRVVELMCLLGDEMRKIGEKPKYQDLLQEGRKLYLTHSSEFASHPVSEVFCINSYADYVSKRGDPAKNEQVRDLSETALKLCVENLEDDHPERAATLLLAGRFAKRMRNRQTASMRLQQALALFLARLGNHVMTVHALKEIGDFFLSGVTKEDLEKALDSYQRAEQMMKHVGMENNKHSINILKNYGVCEMKRKNFSKAGEYLENALLIAERELGADHMWKVMVKSNLALLYEKSGEAANAKTVMKQALEMCHRLKCPVRKMGNSNSEVFQFLRRHRKDFPEAESAI